MRQTALTAADRGLLLLTPVAVGTGGILGRLRQACSVVDAHDLGPMQTAGVSAPQHSCQLGVLQLLLLAIAHFLCLSSHAGP